MHRTIHGSPSAKFYKKIGHGRLQGPGRNSRRDRALPNHDAFVTVLIARDPPGRVRVTLSCRLAPGRRAPARRVHRGSTGVLPRPRRGRVPRLGRSESDSGSGSTAQYRDGPPASTAALADWPRAHQRRRPARHRLCRPPQVRPMSPRAPMASASSGHLDTVTGPSHRDRDGPSQSARAGLRVTVPQPARHWQSAAIVFSRARHSLRTTRRSDAAHPSHGRGRGPAGHGRLSSGY